MNVTDWSNSKEGIEDILSRDGLAGFHYIVETRSKISSKGNKDLNEFVVNGEWKLDQFGQCWRLNWENGKPDISFPLVCTQIEWDALMRSNSVKVWSSSPGLPPDAECLCEVCRQGWSLESAHDAVQIHSTKNIPLDNYILWSLDDVEAHLKRKHHAFVGFQPDLTIKNDLYKLLDAHPVYPELLMRGEWVCVENLKEYKVLSGDIGYLNIWQYFHPKCYEIRTENERREVFTKAFLNAGIEGNFKAIPNGYNSDEFYDPWFEVKTPFGVFTVGWRRRVISLEWENISIDMSIFSEEDVTKWESGIHVYGTENLTRYLKMIRNHLIEK